MSPEDYQTLPWIDVESSNIQRVAWVVREPVEEERGTLYVEFHRGRAYSYASVLLEAYEEMLDADSIGRFFGQEIKGQYDCTPVDVIA